MNEKVFIKLFRPAVGGEREKKHRVTKNVICVCIPASLDLSALPYMLVAPRESAGQSADFFYVAFVVISFPFSVQHGSSGL